MNTGALSGVPVRARPEVPEIAIAVSTEDLGISKHLRKIPSLRRIEDRVDSAELVEYEENGIAKTVAVTGDLNGDREANNLAHGVLKE